MTKKNKRKNPQSFSLHARSLKNTTWDEDLSNRATESWHNPLKSTTMPCSRSPHVRTSSRVSNRQRSSRCKFWEKATASICCSSCGVNTTSCQAVAGRSRGKHFVKLITDRRVKLPHIDIGKKSEKENKKVREVFEYVQYAPQFYCHLESTQWS